MAISRPARAADDDVAGKQIKRTIWSGVLAGVGLVAFADETVFHQLLHWHHFYDKSTLAVGLVSDGLFHAGGFIAMVAGRVAAGQDGVLVVVVAGPVDGEAPDVADRRSAADRAARWSRRELPRTRRWG